MRGKRLCPHETGRAQRITPADAGKTGRRGFKRFHEKDHPRGCGENVLLPTVEFMRSGSPPRMRGKRNLPVTCAANERITPADAGKTLTCRPKPAKPWDHPRGCGENVAILQYLLFPQGSPPRMRGKLIMHSPPSRQRRITPADAGKTREATSARDFD